jgi:hypothetical protein
MLWCEWVCGKEESGFLGVFPLFCFGIFTGPGAVDLDEGGQESLPFRVGGDKIMPDCQGPGFNEVDPKNQTGV